MTQQAVSKRIDGLEKSLGLKLFNRSYHEVELTNDGRAFAELFERFKREFEKTVNQGRKSENLKKNIMTIGYQTWSFYDDVPYRAHMAMDERFPGFKPQGLSLAPYELMKLLGCGAVDIVMLYERLSGSLTGYRSLVLKEIDIALLVSMTRVAVINDADLKAFASEPLLVDVNEIANLREDFYLAGMRTYGISPSKLQIRPNRDSVYLSVELGEGVALGSSISQTGRLSITKFPTGKKDNLICVWREDSQDPRIEFYAELLRKFFQKNHNDLRTY